MQEKSKKLSDQEILQEAQKRYEYSEEDFTKGLFRYAHNVRGVKHGTERVGTKQKTGYREMHILNTRIYEHKLVWLWHHGYIPKMIDHINGDRSDNRISNLREATRSQNAVNKKANTRSITGIRGVSKSRNKWKARIGMNYGTIALGVFDTPEEAGEAYRKAAELYYGEFAPSLSRVCDICGQLNSNTNKCLTCEERHT